MISDISLSQKKRIVSVECISLIDNTYRLLNKCQPNLHIYITVTEGVHLLFYFYHIVFGGIWQLISRCWLTIGTEMLWVESSCTDPFLIIGSPNEIQSIFKTPSIFCNVYLLTRYKQNMHMFAFKMNDNINMSITIEGSMIARS